MKEKGMKKPGVLGMIPIALILIVCIVANVALSQYVEFLNNYFAPKRVDAQMADSTKAIAEANVQEVVGEGVVLLKNDNQVMPVTAGEKVNVFGWTSTSPIYGGTGSGSSSDKGAIDFYQGLRDAGIEYNTDLYEFYKGLGLSAPSQSGWAGSDYTMVEADPTSYTADVMNNAKAFSDTAIVYLARIGGEGGDCPTDMYAAGWSEKNEGKHYLELSSDEESLFELVSKDFDNIIVVINSSNAMELGFIDTYNVDAALWIGGPGATGMEAVGKVIAGEINPSGKLPDTYIYDLTKEPTYYNIGDFTYTNATFNEMAFTGGIGAEKNYKFIDYSEGIYVGYRYYETRFIDNATGALDEAAYNALVQYPFGYGLSYTTFEQAISNHTADADGNISVDVTVTNTGDVAGKSVVEIYYTAPYTEGGIEKAHVVLVNFGKTQILEPGASETLTIAFNQEDMASYDYQCVKASNGAYVLEAGDYEIKLMSDAHNMIDSFTYTVNADIIYDEEHDGARSTDLVAATNELPNETDGTNNTVFMSRADWEGTTPAGYPTDREAPQTLLDMLNAPLAEETFEVVTGADNNLALNDLIGVAKDDPRWQQLVEQMSVSDLVKLTGFGGHQTVEVKSAGKAATTDENGPTGISAMQANDENGASYCSEPVMAATFNVELIRKMGEGLGEEMIAHGLDGIYGPAANIHRSAFSGRNFEYYSEDGTLSYYMAAAEVAGIQTNENVYVYMKHYAINDQETNRIGGIMWCNEQAAREIYLRGFEGAVKVGHAKALMGSINLFNGQWSGANRGLITNILDNEWGFEGFIVTDYASGTYMNADNAIRGGTDTMDTYTGAPVTDTSNTSIHYMQESAKDILYITANSEAQKLYSASWFTPARIIGLLVNIALVAIFVLLVTLRVKKSKKYKAYIAEQENNKTEE